MGKQINIPKIIGGLKPLFIAQAKRTFSLVEREGQQIEIIYLTLGKSDRESGYYVFGCDKDFNTHTDYFFEELEDALEDVAEIYKTEKINWRPLIPEIKKLETIIFREWEFLVDRNITEETYSEIPFGGANGCKCNYCKNFAQQRETIYPKDVKELFSKLGIDFRKEVEVAHYVKNENETHLYGGWFHFKGKMIKGKDCKIPLGNGGSTFDFVDLTPNFGIGFTHDNALTSFNPKDGLVQIEFTVNLPWVLEKELEQE